METLFIPAKRKLNINKKKIEEISKKLPQKIVIAYSIQYKDIASEIKNILSKNHNITKLVQVLGCSKLNLPKATQAILLISSGKFHATSLAFETKLPIYILEQNSLHQITKQDIQIFEKKQKVAYLKFLDADKLGILISIKPGQQNIRKALEFNKKIKDKKSYLFIGDNINTSEFENFGLNCWINTACPRLDMDNNSVINIDKLDFRY
jgi:diphthamide biosynthesis enzyme Dph1/Dph2-like protein